MIFAFGGLTLDIWNGLPYMLGGALTGWVLHWMLDAWYWRRNSIQAVDLTPVQQQLHRKDAAHLHQHLDEPASAESGDGAFLAGRDSESIEPLRQVPTSKVFDPNVDQPQQPKSPIRLEDGPLAPIDKPLAMGTASPDIHLNGSAIPRFTFPYIEVDDAPQEESMVDDGPVLPGLDDEPILAEKVVLRIAEDEARVIQVEETSETEESTMAPQNGVLHAETEDPAPNPIHAAHRDEAHRQLQEALRQVAHLKNTLSRRGIPHDDLQSIRGIGPYAEHKLVAAGIDSFEALANAEEGEIEVIIQPQSWQPIHAAQWIADARAKLTEGDHA